MKGNLILICTILIGLNTYCQNITPSGPTTFCAGSSVVLTAPVSDSGYQWYDNTGSGPVKINGATFNQYTATTNGTYTVTYSKKIKTSNPVTVTVGNPMASFSVSQTAACSTKPVQFKSTSTGNGLQYSWNFGDPDSFQNDSSNIANPQHRFMMLNTTQTPYPFTVTLTVTDEYGCTSLPAAQTVNVDKPNTWLISNANIKMYENTYYIYQCVGNVASDTLSFTSAYQQGTQYQVYWQKAPDGHPDYSSSTPLNNVQYNYPVGTFTMTYIVSDGNCTDTTAYKVFVGSNPGGNLDVPSSAPACTGSTFSYNFTPDAQQNTPGTMYTISVNDGTAPVTIYQPAPPATLQPFTHTFNTSSCTVNPNNPYFTIALTISNVCRTPPTDYITIVQIVDKPAAGFTFTPTDTVCVSSIDTLTSTASALNTIDPTSNTCNQTNYIVWKVTPGTSNVDWKVLPGYSLGNDNNSTNPANWQVGTNTVLIQFSTPGIYTVTQEQGASPGSSCGDSSISKTIYVNPVTTANFSLSQDSGCATLTDTAKAITNTPLYGTNTFYWTITPPANYNKSCGAYTDVQYATGTSDTSQNPVFVFTSPGVYTATLAVSGPEGSCPAPPVSKKITVKGKPVITGIGLSQDTICENGSVTVNPSVGCTTNAATYNWLFLNGLPSTGTALNPGSITYSTPGTYLITFKADNNNTCGATTVTQNITVDTVPSLTVHADTTYCAGTASGAFSFSSNLAGTKLTWTNDNTAIGLGASGNGNISSFTTANNSNTPITATITVTAVKNGCSSQASFTITVNPMPIPPTVTTPVNYCAGTPSVALTAMDGAGDTLLWYTVPAGGNFTRVAPVPSTNPPSLPFTTPYYVSQKNMYGCEGNRDSIKVIVNDTPHIAPGVFQSPSKCGSSDGVINITGLAANTTYTITNTGPALPPQAATNSAGVLTLPSLGPGSYTNITVTTPQGCPSNAVSFILTDPNPPPAPVVTSNSPICTGSLLKLGASTTATGTVTFSWTGPAGSGYTNNTQNPSFTASAADSGVYVVTSTVNNCTSAPAYDTVLVHPTPAPTVNSNSPVCQGGTLTFMSSSNNFQGALTYAWSGPASYTSTQPSPFISNAVPAESGQYTLVATSVTGGCASLPVPVKIVINPVPVIAIDAFTNPTTCGSATGTIVLKGLAPNTQYNITYSGPSAVINIALTSDASGNITITGLAAGVYASISVTTLQNCTSNTVGPVTLGDPNPPPAPVVTSNSPVCTGNPVKLNAATAATGTVTFAWTGPAGSGFTSNAQNPSFTASVIDSGVYVVTATVNNCTSAPAYDTVLVHPTPAPGATSNSPICQGGTLTFTSSANNFQGALTYLWSGPASYTSTQPSPSINSATPAASGAYTLVATSVTGNCPSAPVPVNVVVNPVPVIAIDTFINPINCGSATGTIVLKGLAANTPYTVTYNGPSGLVTISLTSNASGNITISGLPAGNYSGFMVTTQQGCQSNTVGPVTLADPNPPPAPAVTSNSPVCTGNLLTLNTATTATGNVTFSWTGPAGSGFTSSVQSPSFTASAADSGVYVVTATKNNCTSAPAQDTVLVHPTPVPGATSNSPVCQGGTLTLSSTTNNFHGALTFLWGGPASFTSTQPNPSIGNATPANSGSYTLVTTSVTGNCPSLPVIVTVVVNPVPVILIDTFTNPASCGSATGSIVISGMLAGVGYTVIYTGAAGLVSSSLTADASGYITITGLAAGTYTNISVTTPQGCVSNSVGPVTLTNPNPPAAPTATSNSPVCAGGELDLYASPTIPGAIYLWTGPFPGSNVQNPAVSGVTPANSGTYYVTATVNNCTSLPGAVDVVVNANAAVPATSANTPVCSGDMLNLTANSAPVGTGPVTYQWTGPCIAPAAVNMQNPSFNASLACTGTYCVTAFNASCPSPAQGCVNVTVNPTPAITSTYTNPTSCGTNTGAITLYGLNTGLAYTLTYTYNGLAQPAQFPIFANPSGEFAIDNLPAGIYSNIYVTTPASCPSNIVGPDTLINLAPPIPTAGSNSPLCVGGTLNLTCFVAPLTGTVTYTWTGPGVADLVPGNTAQNPSIPVTTIADSGQYTVTATVNGCSVSTSINVVISSKSAGGHTFNDTTVCFGANAGTIQITDYNGAVVSWESSTDNGNTWLTISNTTARQAFTNLTATTLYRAVVQNGVCDTAHSDITTITVINAVPQADAGPNQTLCNQQSANLAATKALLGTGVWTQSSGPATSIAPASSANATVTGLAPGNTYNFLWNVTGPAGCGSSSAGVQIVDRPAITQAVAGPEQDICNFTTTASITLAGNQDPSRPFEQGVWTIVSQPTPANGTLSNANSPTSLFTFSQTGVYTLEWTISDVDSACSPSDSLMILRVSNAPVAAFTATPSGLCTGDFVSVTNNSTNTNVFNWYWGDGLSSTFSSGQHQYTSSGTYSITLVAENLEAAATCADSAKQTVTVAAKIPAVINITPGSPCIPYNLQADALGAGAASLIEWRIFDKAQPPGMFYTTGPTASHVFDFAGTDSIRLIVHNQDVCADSATTIFNVYNIPVTTFSPPSFSTCNHDTTVIYQASTTYAGSDPINYQWFINGQLAGNTNPFNYTFLTPLTSTTPVVYTVALLAQNAGNCGDSSIPGTVTVMPLPQESIQVAPSIIQQQPDNSFTFSAITADSTDIHYTWYMGDPSMQTRSGAEVTYAYSDTGSFNVTLLATNFTSGCTSKDSVIVTLLYVPGYLQVPDAICPGCSKQELRQFLPLGKGLSYYHLTIYNLWGNVIFQTTALNPDGSPQEAWNGQYNGQSIEQDTYRWQIEARFVNGTEWTGMLYPGNSKRVKSGFITVIK